MKLYHLMYISTPTMKVDDEELMSILDRSRVRNLELQITGALMRSEEYFLQYLEGPQIEIERLVQKIGTDFRHQNLLTLSKGEMNLRLFPNWGMGFGNGDTWRKALRHHLNAVRQDVTSQTPIDIIENFLAQYY